MQGNEVNFRFKTCHADGIEVKPFFARILVKHKIGLMSDMSFHIGSAQKPFSSYKGIIFLLVHMNFCMGKIRKPATMVKVHVSQDDVFYVFRLRAQPLYLINRRFLQIKWHDGNEAKELRKPCRICIIFKPQTCVYES